MRSKITGQSRTAGRWLTGVVALAGMSLSAGVVSAQSIQWRNEGAAASSVSRQLTSLDAAEAIASLAAGDTNRHMLVHLRGPVTLSDRAALAEGGVQLLTYVGDNAFFAAAGNVDTARLSQVRNLAAAEAIDVSWKVSTILWNGEIPTWAVVGLASDGSPVIGTYVLFHPDVDLNAAAALLPQYEVVVRDTLETINGLVIELPMTMVEPLAREDAVQWIEHALPRMSELNSSNRARVGADIVQAPPYDLDGSGVTVLVYDGGFARATHVDFGGRLTTHDSSGQSGHATHVSGTVGGDGTASGGTNRGMAPGVTIVSYGFQYDGSGIFLYTNPGDIQADYNQAINTLGADISNNSIGTNTETNGFPCSLQGDYGVTDVLIDSIVRGSLGAPFRVVWAGGNERQGSRCDVEGFGDYYSTAPPAGAKNHLCIGALNSNNDSMTSFSSWGPVDDGRLKPDFTAPGCQSDADGGVTSCSSSSNTSYSTLCGTSMASPTVCGIASLLLEDYRVQFPGQPDPRNSTLKVLFAHNAVDLGNPGPDYQYGYGSVRIQPTIDHMRSGRFYERSLDTGEVVEFQTVVNGGDPQLKVTLAWDDVPGTANVVPSLINDLDVRVFDPLGNEHFAWTLDPGQPSAAAVRTMHDRLNNLEQVLVDNPMAGEWRVLIVGHNVPSGPQPFSLASSHDLFERGIQFGFPAGLPSVLLPGQSEDVDVTVTPVNEDLTEAPVMHVRYDGGTYIDIPLTHLGGTSYTATLPPPTCAATPEFYFTAAGSISGPVVNPPGAPGNAYDANVGVIAIVVDDDFETDTGWTVTNQSLADGPWERGVPAGDGTRGDPTSDYDGSGACWLTDNVAGNSDVDGGPTILTSIAYDLSGSVDPTLSVATWFTNDDNDADRLTIEVANSSAGPWTLVEAIGNSGGWVPRSYSVNDILTPSSTFHVRFSAVDNPNNSVTEAAIDALRIEDFFCDAVLDDCNGNGIVDSDDIASGRSEDSNGDGVPDECGAPCPGDFNGDGQRDFDDLVTLLAAYGVNAGGDIDGDNDTDFDDLVGLLNVYGTPCP